MLLETIWLIDSALLAVLITLFILNKRSEGADTEELGDLGLLLPYIDLKLFATLYALKLLEGGLHERSGRERRGERKDIVIRV